MCECCDLPNIFKLETRPRFEVATVRIAQGNWVWLHRCTECSQLWRVDAFDYRGPQFVVRIPAGADWEKFDATELHKQFLIASRGGLKSESCMWLGCSRPQVKGEVVYCVEHLYQTGTRE